MMCISVVITALISVNNPGWVHCQLVDALGTLHEFEEKIPVVSAEDICVDTVFPREGLLACTVIATWTSAEGRLLSRISTQEPWGVESTTGATELVVFTDALRALP